MRSNDDTLKPIIPPSRRSPSPLRSSPLIPPSSPKKLILPLAKKCNLNFVLNPPSPRSPSQIRQRLEEGGGGRREEGGGKREEGRREERGKLDERRREEGRKEENRREEARREDARREEREDVRREVREEGGGRKRGEIREESIGREGRRESRSREGRDILSRKRSADAPRNNPNLQKLLQNLMESGNSGRYAVNNNPTTQILKSRENSIERNNQRSGRGGVGINTRYGRAENSDIMGVTTKNWNEISGLSGNLNVRNISDNNANLLKDESSRNDNKNEWKNEGIRNDPKNDWKNEGGRKDPKNEYKSEINHKNEYKSELNSKNNWKIGETLRNDQKGDAGGIKKSSSRLLNAKNDNISIKKLLNLGRLLDGNEEILTEKKKVQNKEDVRSTVKENFNEFSLNVNINIENTLIKAATPVETPRNDKASLFKREEGRREEGRREEGRREEGRREEENRRREEDSRREESRKEESRREESRREQNKREEEGERRREEEGGRRKEEEGRREEEIKTIGILENKMKGMMKEQPKKEVMTRTGKDFFAGEEKKKDIEINDRLCKEKIDTVIFFN